MGTSAAGVPVTINGEAVEAVAAGGSWAKLVELPQIGGNLFTIAQGGSTVNLTVERRAPAGSAGGLTHDGSVEVPAGTSVRLPNLITSLLYDPSGDDKISETARSGAVGLVTACAETVRSGKTTWAYQLSSGDWVLASNTEALGTGQPRANFTGAAAQAVTSLDAAAPGVAAADAQPDGRTEVLSFAGSGTPLAYTNQYAQQNALSLKFYETDFAADFAVTGASLVKRVEVKPVENGAELVLYFEKPLWGHLVQYADGATPVSYTHLDVYKRQTEYSVRTAMEAVYTLLDVDRGVPEVFGSVYDVRCLLDATVKMMDGAKLTDMKLPWIARLVENKALDKVKGTAIEDLLNEYHVI